MLNCKLLGNAVFPFFTKADAMVIIISGKTEVI